MSNFPTPKSFHFSHIITLHHHLLWIWLLWVNNKITMSQYNVHYPLPSTLSSSKLDLKLVKTFRGWTTRVWVLFGDLLTTGGVTEVLSATWTSTSDSATIAPVSSSFTSSALGVVGQSSPALRSGSSASESNSSGSGLGSVPACTRWSIHFGGRPGPWRWFPYQKLPAGNESGHLVTLLAWTCTGPSCGEYTVTAVTHLRHSYHTIRSIPWPR